MDTFHELKEAIRAYGGQNSGVTIDDILVLPESLNKVLKRMIRRRQGLSQVEFGQMLGLTVEETQQLVALLLEKGLLKQSGKDKENQLIYRVHLAPKPKSNLPQGLLQAFDDL